MKRGVPLCTSSLYLAKRSEAREARMLVGGGGMPPRKMFDFRPSEIVSGVVLG